MNEIFNLRRFGKCLSADLSRAVRRYGITFLVLSLLGVIVYIIDLVLTLIFGRDPDDSLAMGIPAGVVCLTALIAFICGMPNALYGRVTKPHLGADFLMLPASTLEKWLSMTLVCLVILPVLFIAIWCGTDVLLSACDSGYNAICTADTSDVSPHIPFFYFYFQIAWLITVFLFGGICFKRHKFILTALCYAAFCIVLAVIVLSCVNTDHLAVMASGVAEGGISLFSFRYAWPGYLAELLLLALCYLRIKKMQH